MTWGNLFPSTPPNNTPLPSIISPVGSLQWNSLPLCNNVISTCNMERRKSLCFVHKYVFLTFQLLTPALTSHYLVAGLVIPTLPPSLSIYLFLSFPLYLPIDLSIYLSPSLSIYLSLSNIYISLFPYLSLPPSLPLSHSLPTSYSTSISVSFFSGSFLSPISLILLLCQIL